MRIRGIALALLAVSIPAAASTVPLDEPIRPIEPAAVTNPALVELGKKLFFDPRLSKSGFISCNSCHNLSLGGSDNLKTSIGHNWQKGPINSPTVLNSSLNLAQFWDGRAADLQEQAGGPIANPGEMAFTHELAIHVLESIPQYVAEFRKVSGRDQIDIGQVTRAIAAFEETLVTPDSRFDHWLGGDSGALSAEELAGYGVFKEAGCVACHNGPGAGGTSFQRMGVKAPYVTSSPEQGRIEVTGDEFDRMRFKVPTLRNVELTYPYFHDGEAETLAEAVEVMGRLQLGREFTPAETKQVVAFLATLTGTQPSFVLPLLPPSSERTPPPQPFE
ncbi:MAG: cytochrome biosis protein CcsA [Acidobacteria bacterium]|jgi:cytochrome c peroxidase|nr:cytochrome biosis protein CcsA [Acidobacteriota bacterium]